MFPHVIFFFAIPFDHPRLDKCLVFKINGYAYGKQSITTNKFFIHLKIIPAWDGIFEYTASFWIVSGQKSVQM